jgi:glutamate carboxypeptidase
MSIMGHFSDLARRAIHEELGLPLKVLDVATGGTDAAFAALKTTAPVIEGFGLSSYGAHSNDAVYVELESMQRDFGSVILPP